MLLKFMHLVFDNYAQIIHTTSLALCYIFFYSKSTKLQLKAIILQELTNITSPELPNYCSSSLIIQIPIKKTQTCTMFLQPNEYAVESVTDCTLKKQRSA